MEKIKVVQIGIGHDHAYSTLVTLKNQKDMFDLAGVVVLDGEDHALKRYPDFLDNTKQLTLEEAFAVPGLEAVFVETDDTRLTKYAQMAADRGLHIQMDKPGSCNHEDYIKLLSTMKAKGKVFHPGYMYRYNPAVQKLLADVKAGKLGEILCVEAQMSCTLRADKLPWLVSFPGGMLYYLGCHLIDLILQIQGVPDAITPLSTATKLGGYTVDDFGMAVFQYEKGVSMVKSIAMEIGGYMRRQFVVCGTEGTVELRPFEYYAPDVEGWELPLYTGVSEVYKSDIIGKGWSDQRKCYDTPPYDRYIAMVRAFGSIIRGEMEPPVSYEHEELLHRVLLHACGVEIDYKAEVTL